MVGPDDAESKNPGRPSARRWQDVAADRGSGARGDRDAGAAETVASGGPDCRASRNPASGTKTLESRQGERCSCCSAIAPGAGPSVTWENWPPRFVARRWPVSCAELRGRASGKKVTTPDASSGAGNRLPSLGRRH